MILFISIISLIVAVIAIFTTFYSISYTQSNSINNKSEWRKSLYDLSSKEQITFSDIQRLRSSLRFNKKKKSQTIRADSVDRLLNFDNMTCLMIEFCDYVIDNPHDLNIQSYNYQYVDKLTRIFARYLLKHQWETYPKFYFFRKEWLRRESPRVIKEVLTQIQDEKLFKYTPIPY